MRPSKSVASVVLSAALVLVGAPGLVETFRVSPDAPLDPAEILAVNTTSRVDRWTTTPVAMDEAGRSAGHLTASAVFVEPGDDIAPPLPDRAVVKAPRPHSGWEYKTPRYTVSGYASFYAAGYTAMRLPRGTHVVVCGAGGCIERVINDYGPSAAVFPNRIADLYTADFFDICGCPWWSGTTWVTVSVY